MNKRLLALCLSTALLAPTLALTQGRGSDARSDAPGSGISDAARGGGMGDAARTEAPGRGISEAARERAGPDPDRGNSVSAPGQQVREFVQTSAPGRVRGDTISAAARARNFDQLQPPPELAPNQHRALKPARETGRTLAPGQGVRSFVQNSDPGRTRGKRISGAARTGDYSGLSR